MRRKAVTAWCMWEPGWFPDLTTACETQSLSRHQATLRGWSPKYVIRVEIRPARKAKAPKPKRWSLVDSKTFREGSWADPEPQEKKAKEKRRSRAGGSR